MEHFHPFLQFATTGGMGNKRYRSRLSQLIAIKKGEQYAEIMSWIRISFTLLKSAIICLRCSWAIKRFLREVKNADIDIENVEGAIRSNYSFFSTFLHKCMLAFSFNLQHTILFSAIQAWGHFNFLSQCITLNCFYAQNSFPKWDCYAVFIVDMINILSLFQ